MPCKAVSKKAYPAFNRKQREQWYRDWKEFERLCELGLVASGGWCKCCERYDCGCHQAFLNQRK